jgi:cytidine deaminase
MDEDRLRATVDACRELIDARFPDGDPQGAAVMLLDDGTIETGTAPVAVNPAVQVCHETEPYLAAFRRGRKIVASVCLHREGGSVLVLSPCGVCRERLAVHGPELLAAVPAAEDPEQVVWKPLSSLLPSYWITVFDDAPDDWVA